MFWLIVSVSESVSSRLWRPTTARRVVWAIWSIAADTFSIATIADRVVDAVVGDGGHVDAHVVLGDDALRLDRHRHDPQGDPMDAVHERHDEDQSGAASTALDPAQAELHAAFVPLEDSHA